MCARIGAFHYEIEGVQRRATTQLLASIRGLAYPEHLSKLELTCHEMSKWGHMIDLYKFLLGLCYCENTNLQKRDTATSTWGPSLKNWEKHFPLWVRGKFFSVTVISTWTDQLEEVLTTHLVNAFKSGFNKFWENKFTHFNPECYRVEN